MMMRKFRGTKIFLGKRIFFLSQNEGNFFCGETRWNSKTVRERNHKIGKKVNERREEKFFKHTEVHVVCFGSLEPLK